MGPARRGRHADVLPVTTRSGEIGDRPQATATSHMAHATKDETIAILIHFSCAKKTRSWQG